MTVVAPAQPKLKSEAATKLAEAISALDQDPEFLVSYWKSTFIEGVLGAMEEPRITKKELAKRLKWSPQYVGRILNETANFTIETMVKIALALDRQPYFGLHRYNERVEIVPAIVRPGVYFKLPCARAVERKLSQYVAEKHPQIKLGGTDAGHPEVGTVSTDRFNSQVA